MLTPRDFPATRASLLAALRDGPGAPGWREFFEYYAPAVYRVARMRALDKHDADDIVQQVMLSITRHIDGFNYDRDRGQFRQWVRRIAENKINDYRRRRSKVTAALRDDLPGEQVDVESLWDAQWRLQDILFCLDEVAADFAPRRVEAFRLYVMEDISAAEVAERLGMTVGHVYVTRTQIINRIRERMACLEQDTER